MAIMPENLNQVNKENPSIGLNQVEDYINYMHERIEFAFKNSSLGSGADIDISGLETEIAAVRNRLNGLTYSDLDNKPQLEGVTLVGNKHLNEDHIHDYLTNLEIEALLQNAGI